MVQLAFIRSDSDVIVGALSLRVRDTFITSGDLVSVRNVRRKSFLLNTESHVNSTADVTPCSCSLVSHTGQFH